MFYLESLSNDPFFNIATEEYLLHHSDADFFMLYIDEPSVIVGKHQNTLAEINYKHIIENNIPVIRRISGGGTVFHDHGNLNFCFIANSREGFQIDFKKYIQPVVDTLRESFGIEAEIGGKNDIRVNDLKVSGNAEHVFKKRVLHHGTLLVNSDLQNLSKALQVVPEKYIDKAVKSIRSKVANLSQFNEVIDMEDLKQSLKERLDAMFTVEDYVLSPNEIEIIQYKVKEKFQTWEWNYGYSPAYTFTNNGIELQVENGIITSSKIQEYPELERKLIGQYHNYFILKKATEQVWDLF